MSRGGVSLNHEQIALLTLFCNGLYTASMAEQFRSSSFLLANREVTLTEERKSMHECIVNSFIALSVVTLN